MQIVKKLLLALFVMTIFLVPSNRAEVLANEWVYDELGVVSEETKDKVKSYNEEVFPTYERKPQLGIVVLDKLPSGYTIDSFKRDIFNELGVGTKEENCGMLFIFSISDRLYGLEIGDGFERGSLLRKDLETDFISESTKDMLRNGEYDEVISLITEYLASLMADEENGVYVWKEQERLIKQQEEQRLQKELELQLAKSLYGFIKIVLYIIVGVTGFGIVLTGGCALFELIRSVRRKKKAEQLVEQNYRHVRLSGVSEEKIIKYIRYYCDEVATRELETEFVSLLYDLFCKETENYFKDADLEHAPGVYMEYFKECNTRKSFVAGTVTDVELIIRHVNQIEEQKAQQFRENQQRAREFAEEKAEELAEMGISVDRMKESLMALCRYGDCEVSLPVLRKRYSDELKELKLERDYEKFLAENQDRIDKRYFDSRSFYNAVKNSKEGREYTGINYSWMLPLLMLHMSNNRHTEEVRIKRQEQAKAETARREQSASNHIHSTSFGSGFGGGTSSGGGFSGGW